MRDQNRKARERKKVHVEAMEKVIKDWWPEQAGEITFPIIYLDQIKELLKKNVELKKTINLMRIEKYPDLPLIPITESEHE